MADRLSYGGCLCGAVRYQVAGAPFKVANCHCSMCRRQSGAAFLTYAAFACDDVTFTKAAPVPFQSSPQATRGHCATCASPLSFVFLSDPATIWMTVGSFDNPDEFSPGEHWYVAGKLPWVTIPDDLPQWPGAPTP